MKLPNLEIIITWKHLLFIFGFVVIGLAIPIIWIYGLGKWWSK